MATPNECSRDRMQQAERGFGHAAACTTDAQGLFCERRSAESCSGAAAAAASTAAGPAAKRQRQQAADDGRQRAKRTNEPRRTTRDRKERRGRTKTARPRARADPKGQQGTEGGQDDTPWALARPHNTPGGPPTGFNEFWDPHRDPKSLQNPSWELYMAIKRGLSRACPQKR